jgi:hypothetical protein
VSRAEFICEKKFANIKAERPCQFSAQGVKVTQFFSKVKNVFYRNPNLKIQAVHVSVIEGQHNRWPGMDPAKQDVFRQRLPSFYQRRVN